MAMQGSWWQDQASPPCPILPFHDRCHLLGHGGPWVAGSKSLQWAAHVHPHPTQIWEACATHAPARSTHSGREPAPLPSPGGAARSPIPLPAWPYSCAFLPQPWAPSPRPHAPPQQGSTPRPSPAQLTPSLLHFGGLNALHSKTYLQRAMGVAFHAAWLLYMVWYVVSPPFSPASHSPQPLDLCQPGGRNPPFPAFFSLKKIKIHIFCFKMRKSMFYRVTCAEWKTRSLMIMRA